MALLDGINYYMNFEGVFAEARLAQIGTPYLLDSPSSYTLEAGNIGQCVKSNNGQPYFRIYTGDPFYDYSASDEFTISGWFYFTQLPADNNFTIGFIGGRYNGQGLTIYRYNAINGMRLYSDTSGGALYSDIPNYIFPLNEWLHITLRKGIGYATIIVNNVNITPLTIPFINSGLMQYPTDTPFNIHGKCEEIAGWNRYLSDEEVAEYYNNGLYGGEVSVKNAIFLGV